MPATFIATCPLCGLGFAHRSILELHVREDHVSRRHSRPPGESAAPGGSPARPDDTPGSHSDDAQPP